MRRGHPFAEAAGPLLSYLPAEHGDTALRAPFTPLLSRRLWRIGVSSHSANRGDRQRDALAGHTLRLRVRDLGPYLPPLPGLRRLPSTAR